MNWLDVFKEMIIEQLVKTLLAEHFPQGIPAEAMQAVMPEVERLLDGEPVNWFELRRLVLSVTNEALVKLEEAI